MNFFNSDSARSCYDVILPGVSILIIHPCKPNVREVNCLVPPRVGYFFEVFSFYSLHFFCKWQLIWPLYPDPFSLIFCHCTFNLIFSHLGYRDFPRAWAFVLPADEITSSDGPLKSRTENSALPLPLSFVAFGKLLFLLSLVLKSSWHAVPWVRVEMGWGRVCTLLSTIGFPSEWYWNVTIK